MKKWITSVVAITLSLVMLLSVLAMAWPAQAAQAEVISKGESVTVTLENAAGKTLQSATSADPSKVEANVTGTYGDRISLKGVAVGQTNVTVYYTENGQRKNETISVNVIDTSNSQRENVTLNLGNSYTYTTRAFSSIGSLKSSDSSIVSVSTTSNTQVVLQGQKKGTATITFNGTLGGSTIYYVYSVSVDEVQETSITETKVSLTPGQTATINPRDNNVVLSSTNTSNIAKIEKTSDNKLLITGVAAGTVDLQYTYSKWTTGSASATTFTVKVPVEVKGSPTSNAATENIALTVGESKTVMSGMSSIGITSSGLSSVAAGSIATSGTSFVVKGMAPGSTDIIVTYNSASGSGTKTFHVVVTAAATDTSTAPPTATGNSPTTGLYFSKNAVAATKGKKYRYSNIKLNGVKTASSSLLWLSANPTIVSVESKTGVFKALKAGKARLIAVDKQGKYVNYLIVTVK